MTESRPASRRPGSAPVFWISVVLFCVLLGLLTHRLAGESSAATGAAAEPPRKVIVRRVVTTVVPAGSAGTSATGPATATAPVEAPAEESAPVTTSAS